MPRGCSGYGPLGVRLLSLMGPMCRSRAAVPAKPIPEVHMTTTGSRVRGLTPDHDAAGVRRRRLVRGAPRLRPRRHRWPPTGPARVKDDLAGLASLREALEAHGGGDPVPVVIETDRSLLLDELRRTQHPVYAPIPWSDLAAFGIEGRFPSALPGRTSR